MNPCRCCLFVTFLVTGPVGSWGRAEEITHAVVRVFAGDGAGCGTLIHTENAAGHILTAAHVVGRNTQARAVWHDGYSAIGQVIAIDQQLDVALLAVHVREGDKTIPLAGSEAWPPQGAAVELIGYGGGRLRHWQAKVNGYAMTEGIGRHQTLSLATQTIGGDSGGAIIYRGKLVGVIWGGPLADPGGPMLATHGTCCVAIQTFLQQHALQFDGAAQTQITWPRPPACRGGNCPLPSRVPAPVTPVDNSQKLLEQIARLEARLAKLERSPILQFDIDDASEQLLDRIAADPRFRGPPGQDGRDGVDGRDAGKLDVDRIANQVKQRLAGAIRIRVEPVR